MQSISMYVSSLITLLVSPLFAAEIPHSDDSTFAAPKFSITRHPFPSELKPFIINETPGIHENITLTLTQEQYEQFKHLIDPLTHISIILRVQEGVNSAE